MLWLALRLTLQPLNEFMGCYKKNVLKHVQQATI